MKRKQSSTKVKMVVFAVSFCLLGATVYALTYRPQVGPTIQIPEPVVKAAPEKGKRVRGESSTAGELLSWGPVKITPEAAVAEPEVPQAAPSPAEAKQSTVGDDKGAAVRSTPRAAPVVVATVSRARQARRTADPGPRGRGKAAVRNGVMASFEAEPEEYPEPDEEEQVEGGPTMPEMPRREEVAQVMNSIRRLVQRCYDTSMVPGQVDMTLTVEGRTGRVVKTHVSERSSTAICIRRLARTLRFPKFSRTQITIEHPYTFR